MENLLRELQSVQLRHTCIQHDASAPRPFQDLDDFSDTYDAAVLSCNIEKWLPTLQPLGLTFDSLLVPLMAENAQTLICAYEETRASKENSALLSDRPLNQHETALRATLKVPLQSALEKLNGGDGGGCVVKTSSRSPKDAAARTGALERLLHQKLSMPSNRAALTQDEEMARVMSEAEGAALRFSNAKDVIRSLILSDRIYQDLTLAMRYPHSFQQNIVLRRWEPVTIDMEFRCFLHRGRLTAISQYAYQLFFPSLLAKADAIRRLIAAYFDAGLRDALVNGGFETCIVDVALLTHEQDLWQARVIELNPYLSTTDAGLFSWDRERDILEGRITWEGHTTYPVMRVSQRAQKSLAAMPKSWKEVMLRVRQDMLAETGALTET